MTYLKLDLSHKREVQKKFIEHTQSSLQFDPKLEDALDWEHSEKTLAWLEAYRENLPSDQRGGVYMHLNNYVDTCF